MFKKILFFQDNVIPASGEALINHRVHPAQSIDDAIQYDRDVINDPTVKVIWLIMSR